VPLRTVPRPIHRRPTDVGVDPFTSHFRQIRVKAREVVNVPQVTFPIHRLPYAYGIRIGHPVASDYGGFRPVFSVLIRHLPDFPPWGVRGGASSGFPSDADAGK
jgi:hypothetical protein